MALVMIVEDDVELNAITKTYLEHNDFDTVCVYSCAEAEEQFKRGNIDLIILDMILPDGGGDNLCTRIRKSSDCPIIFLSCIDDKETMINALAVGGDDYLTKPVDYDKLVAKIRAILRRVSQSLTEDSKELLIEYFHQFYIDKNRHHVVRTVNGNQQEIPLSPIEYQILICMADHKDTLLLYSNLYNEIWESESLGDVRTLMVHISNLRKKLDPLQTGIITTVRGAGYFFQDIKA